MFEFFGFGISPWALIAVIAVVFWGILMFTIQYSYRNKLAGLHEIRFVWLLITALAGYPLHESIVQGLIPWIVVSAILILFGMFNFCRIQFFWIKKAQRNEQGQLANKLEEERVKLIDHLEKAEIRKAQLPEVLSMIDAYVANEIERLRRITDERKIDPELVEEALLASIRSILLEDERALEKLKQETVLFDIRALADLTD